MGDSTFNFGALVAMILLWAVVIAVITLAVYGVIRLIRRARRKDAEQREMLDLMRGQANK